MMNPCQSRRSDPPGAFTLVEVLIVVTIMAIAGAVIVPQMLNAGSLHVQAAARSIISDLLVVQNEAVVRQSTRQIVFDVENNQYTLTDGAGNAMKAPWGHEGKYRVNFTKDMRFSLVKIENAEFGNDKDKQATLSFNDLGEPSSGGSVDVVSGTIRYRITVTPFTGKVTVATVPATSGG